MKGLLLAVAIVLGFAASADAHGRTVVRRGVFGRTVVVQRGFNSGVVVNRGFNSRGVIVDPHFGSRSFHHGGNVVVDQFGRAIIIR